MSWLFALASFLRFSNISDQSLHRPAQVSSQNQLSRIHIYHYYYSTTITVITLRIIIIAIIFKFSLGK